MKIAVEGCAHGELDKIYETIEVLETQNNIHVDLLIICGDFQAVRNPSDLDCMAVPAKYKKLNTFFKYYSGEKKAPVLTIFIGGNHEASNYMSELAYGGWVCENIFYMGYANVIQVGNLRIAGLSGIYKGQNYIKGHYEILPYDEGSIRSIYHVRNIDVFRLKTVKKPLDIFISHDWPRGIQEYGNKNKLLRFKPFFKNDMDNGKLGSRPSEELLLKLRPSYWFAAHLHCQFAASVPHDDDTHTKFLALDKCLPRRKFLKILDIGSEEHSLPLEIKYDPEWLCILKSTNHLLSVSKSSNYMPGKGCSDRWDFTVSDDELSAVTNLFNNDFKVPQNFVPTAQCHSTNSCMVYSKPTSCTNPQTTVFCEKLGINDPLQLLLKNEKKEPKKYSFIEDLNITNISETSFDPDQSSSLGNKKDSDSDSDSVSGLFVIDTLPNDSYRFSSSTSNNKSNEQNPYPYTSSPTSTAKSSKIIDFPLFKEQNEIESIPDTPTASPPVKLKRRNLSIYSNNEEVDN